MAHDDQLPMRLRVTAACGCTLTFGVPRPDERVVLEEFARAERCTTHGQASRLPASGTVLLGAGPWWSWDANLANRTATTAGHLWTFEPEHLYVLTEQYVFLEGHVEPFGPVRTATWLNHVPVVH